jgi:LacI family transcriptional regulator
MVTQQDVARETGLSQTAVSLALRNRPDIPAATIRRVRAAARRLGYRPDPLISAPMARRQRRRKGSFRAKVAFLTGFVRREKWRPSACASGSFDGARRAAANILIRIIETNERGEARVPTTTLVRSFAWNDGRTPRRPLRP